jgi:hypothetical protein
MRIRRLLYGAAIFVHKQPWVLSAHDAKEEASFASGILIV